MSIQKRTIEKGVYKVELSYHEHQQLLALLEDYQKVIDTIRVKKEASYYHDLEMAIEVVKDAKNDIVFVEEEFDDEIPF